MWSQVYTASGSLWCTWLTLTSLGFSQDSMCQQIKDQRRILLAGARKAAELEIQEALGQLEEPALLISCAGATGRLPAAHLLGPAALHFRLVSSPQKL